MLENVRYVSFSSAGTNASLFIGVMDTLEDEMGAAAYETWRRSLRGVSGTSAGCFAALSLALGINRSVRNRLMTAPTFCDARFLVRRPDIGLLLSDFGIDNGDGIRDAAAQLLEAGGISASLTLGGLRRLVDIDIVFVTTSVVHKKAVHLCAATHPQLRVVDALYASAAIPLLYTPFYMSPDMPFIDGCMTQSLPDVFVSTETLYVEYVFQEAANTVTTLQDYVSSLAMFTGMTADACEARPHHIRIPLIGAGFDFGVNVDRVKHVHYTGMICTRDWLQGGKTSFLLGVLVLLGMSLQKAGTASTHV
jgi:hypothetical protein